MKRALSVWLTSFSLDVLRRQDRRRAGSPEAGVPNPALRGRARRAHAGPAARPILLVSQEGQRRVVAACCEAARRAGVRPGMPVAQARAIFPRRPGQEDEPVRLVAADPDLDHRTLRSLAGWALRFSPLVAPDPPDGLRIDISGCQRVLGGEDRITHLVIDGLARLGFHARAAIAPTHACAWAAARFARAPSLAPGGGDDVGVAIAASDRGRTPRTPSVVTTRPPLAGPPPTSKTRSPPPLEAGEGAQQPHPHALIIPDGHERRTLAPLPVAALRIDAFTIAGLAEVGVTTIGQVLELPRSALHARFGRGALRERAGAPRADAREPDLLLRLDQALGQAMEPLNPVRPHNPLRVQRVFDGPTTRADAIELATRGLLDAACALLQQRESGARVLELTLSRADLAPELIRITLSRPTRDARHLWSLIRPKLERAPLGFGVEGVDIHIPWLARLRHVEPGFRPVSPAPASPGCVARAADAPGRWPEIPTHDAEAAGAELIDTLASRLGREGVLRATLTESHLPERAATLRTCAADAATPGRTASLPDGDRPTLLLPHPRPVDVMALTPDGPVLSIRLDGRTHHAAACLGPHRLAPEWWRGASSSHAPGETRDYFKLQDQHGRWLWLFRTLERGKWFLHGEWA